VREKSFEIMKSVNSNLVKLKAKLLLVYLWAFQQAFFAHAHPNNAVQNLLLE